MSRRFGTDLSQGFGEPIAAHARSADFQVYWITDFRTRHALELRRGADLEIGDTVGLETCATALHARDARSVRAKEISTFVKCRAAKSGDRGVTQHTMKAKDADISEGSQRELKHAAQRELAAGVLKQAAQDLRRLHGATSNIERELYLDAYRWLTVGECSSPFSFVNVCQLLNVAPEKIRQELIGDSSLGAVDYWTQHCTRAARGVQTSLTQLFPNERNAGMPVRYAEAAT